MNDKCYAIDFWKKWTIVREHSTYYKINALEKNVVASFELPILMMNVHKEQLENHTTDYLIYVISDFNK